MKLLNKLFGDTKWYKWAKENDTQSHFYGLSLIFAVVSFTILFTIDIVFNFELSTYWDGFIALIAGTTVSLFLAFYKEKKDDTGFSWRDIKNGVYGMIFAVFLLWLATIIKSFIESLKP